VEVRRIVSVERRGVLQPAPLPIQLVARRLARHEQLA
jgi:hypothetical protein